MAAFIAWLQDIRSSDVKMAGAKGANLGELVAAGLPVPPGFVVTTEALRTAMSEAGVAATVRELHDVSDLGEPTVVADVAADLQQLVTGMEMPQAVRRAVVDAYRQLGPSATVAVRSSATTEDAEGASFAGMHRTFTNVHGEEAVLEKVHECWASLYDEPVIAYRAARGITDEAAIAVVIQLMVQSERSGVMFTADPATGDPGRIVIEGALGLGEVVVSGQVEPDTYSVARDGAAKLRLVGMRLGMKNRKIVRGELGGDVVLELHGDEATRRVLDDDEVLAIARLGLDVERHYGHPQDIEWAIAGGTTYLLQSRPITTMPPVPGAGDAGIAGRVVAHGLPAAAGTATGPVRVLSDPDQAGDLRTGEVLVVPMTNPGWIPAICRAAAVVTDVGGLTCHGAIVSRELGVPCVVGARTATRALRDGDIVTVDGRGGVVLAGAVATGRAETTGRSASIKPMRPLAAVPAPETREPLATRVYVTMSIVDDAERTADLAVDGVLLQRSELLLTSRLQPRHLRDPGGREELATRMARSLLRITRAFAPRPVVYPIVDARTDDFRGVIGGSPFDATEPNPMIGSRGRYRYVNGPELLNLELELLHRVREETPNLHLLIPFFPSTWQLAAVLDAVDASPLGRQPGLRRWVQADAASAADRIPEYAALGIDGVSIDSTTLVAASAFVDPGPSGTRRMDRMEAELDTLAAILGASRDAGITSCLAGRPLGDWNELADHMVRQGLTSIAVASGDVARTRRILRDAEQRLSHEVAGSAS